MTDQAPLHRRIPYAEALAAWLAHERCRLAMVPVHARANRKLPE